MEVLYLGQNNMLTYDTESHSITLQRRERPPLTLSPEQMSILYTKLETIEAEAIADWQIKGEKEPFWKQLGSDVYLSVVEFQEHIYFDIRKFWIVPSTGEVKPTKRGVRLNRSEIEALKRYGTSITAEPNA